MTFDQIKQVISQKTVGIAGCGGLGSNCAVALARVGVGKLIIADFDVIDESNLNRQYYYFDQVGQKKSYTLQDNLYFVNSRVEVVAHDKKLGTADIKRIYKGCDVIVEAFDLAEMKEMIIETVLEKMPGIPLVVGVGMAGWGDNNSLRTRYEGNLYICGDERSGISEKLPPLAPRVGIVANMQANQVLEILLKGELK
ncbi:MAG: sulfur carrier protein ThiS adenylyltransferase ThiF [Bacteroidales bacterium]|nr:sulfur carrier protein ThiS adenylyltransferase ThiF [Bacteroidales bacterium]MCF8344246.1 sulfur carrier protein ThiS adenylyltransferase ThiF [Bacteroidales bacterium]MCF8350704.1 sulfur carrier protein ThiS adenylyltransferase ThiF [Bacteroidales bacterium]MCF8377515.1 sulfur carrier protein ThiS adenylyltransferase ThiF [Bacteroidales bacterium]MCF8401818.1 sulfur carrier protein ThiS adenylyltransferase ThiF [Bacteroidales bacterium]